MNLPGDLDTLECLQTRKSALLLVGASELGHANPVNLQALAAAVGAMADALGVPDEELFRAVRHGREMRQAGHLAWELSGGGRVQ